MDFFFFFFFFFNFVIRTVKEFQFQLKQFELENENALYCKLHGSCLHLCNLTVASNVQNKCKLTVHFFSADFAYLNFTRTLFTRKQFR